MPDWSNIVQQHGPLVWRTAYRMLGNEADAADCCQLTFTCALELDCRQIVHNWPGLLKRLATARALDCARSRRRSSHRLMPLSDDTTVDGKARGPAEAAQSSELAGHLRDALAELEARQAQVFCLAGLDGLSYQEIAEQMGVTVNHVGVLLNRARAALQKRLAAHRPVTAAKRTTKELPL